jgi:hypothetical protein
MENIKTTIPTDLIPITKIFDREFQDLFYSHSNNMFYTKNKRFKHPAIHNLRPVMWNTINLKYTNKNGEEKHYSYRYACLPFESSYIRLKESEWLKSKESLMIALNTAMERQEDCPTEL